MGYGEKVYEDGPLKLASFYTTATNDELVANGDTNTLLVLFGVQLENVIFEFRNIDDDVVFSTIKSYESAINCTATEVGRISRTILEEYNAFQTKTKLKTFIKD